MTLLRFLGGISIGSQQHAMHRDVSAACVYCGPIALQSISWYAASLHGL